MFLYKGAEAKLVSRFLCSTNANWTNILVNLKDKGPDPKFHARPCPLTLRGGNRKSSSYRQHVLLQRYS